MYYEYLHKEGLQSCWIYCIILDPARKQDKLYIRYKLGTEEHDAWVPANSVRLVTGSNEMETSQ
jgi:hypothetical protein